MQQARTRARSALRRLPLPVRRVLRDVYRAVRPARPPLEHTVTMPADVANVAALRAWLRDTDVFTNAAEADAYLSDSLERFRITMALLPDLPAGSRVLELGSNPYFLTRLLLRRGLTVTCANYFGEGPVTRMQQVVTGPRSGERHVFDFDHFNIERDRFPYDDGSFDMVLCCEILEHLPNDPIHMLAEVHRVLVPGGRLLLTTPNATRIDNLVRMVRGDNVYEELSGYGTYGRHNREYTVSELRRLLTACGYEELEVTALDIHRHGSDWEQVLPGAATTDRGCNLFAVARAAGEPRWPYPRWLYSSQHALRRVVRADLVMGCNDELQSRGLHDAEVIGGRPARWMGAAARASAVLSPAFSGPATLLIEGLAQPDRVGPLRLHASLGDRHLEWEIPPGGEPFTLAEAVEVEAGEQEVVLWTDRTWRPVDCGINADPRTLSVALCAVRLEPAQPATRKGTQRRSVASARTRS